MIHLDMRMNNAEIALQVKRGSIDAGFTQPTGKGQYIPPQCDLYVTPIKVDIDSAPSRTAVGIYTYSGYRKKMSEKDIADFKEGVSRRVNQGREAMENGAKTDILVQINWQNMLLKQGKLTLVSMPAPEITVHPGEVKGEVKPGKCSYEITPGKSHFDFTPTETDVVMKQYASVSIKTSGTYNLYA